MIDEKKEPLQVFLNKIHDIEKVKMVPVVKNLKKKKTEKNVSKTDNTNINEPIEKPKESVKLINTGYARVYDEVNDSKGRRKRHQIREDVNQWSKVDFSMYIRSKYWDKYNKDWGLNPLAVPERIGRIMDVFQDKMGYYSNIAFKKYIDFFFERYVDKIGGVDGDSVFINKLYSSDLLDNFKSTYNHAKEMAKENKKRIIKNTSFTYEDLSTSFSLGEAHLICNYGIVLAFHFMKHKDIDKNDIFSNIIEICEEIDKSGKFEVIRNSTQKFKYPSYLDTSDLKKLIDSLDKNINIEFENIENKMFNFLKEKNV